jgi:hypothetical protein
VQLERSNREGEECTRYGPGKKVETEVKVI